VLCLASDEVSPPEAIRIVDAYLQTAFEGGRHEARVVKLEQLGVLPSFSRPRVKSLFLCDCLKGEHRNSSSVMGQAGQAAAA